MDINIYRIILLKSLSWKELIKLTECKKFYQIVNCYSVWVNIFKKKFPDHMEMIQNKKWEEIKDIFKDLWINGSYFYAPTLIDPIDNSFIIENVNNYKIIKEIKIDKENRIVNLLTLHEKTKHKRTNEKWIARIEYGVFIKKYPSIFYNNLKYNVTIIFPYGKNSIGKDENIFVCTEIKLFENSVEI